MLSFWYRSTYDVIDLTTDSKVLEYWMQSRDIEQFIVIADLKHRNFLI